jgi:hypothetical protein
MLHGVFLVKIYVSDEHIASIFSVKGTANVVPTSLILLTLMMEAISPSETSVLTRVTGRNNP